jgi:putative FmdB family regulatory protein
MPLYGFSCGTCENTWDELMSMTEYGDTLVFTCPKCGAEHSKDARNDVGDGLRTVVQGVGKGRHNSSDWS